MPPAESRYLRVINSSTTCWSSSPISTHPRCSAWRSTPVRAGRLEAHDEPAIRLEISKGSSAGRLLATCDSERRFVQRCSPTGAHRRFVGVGIDIHRSSGIADAGCA